MIDMVTQNGAQYWISGVKLLLQYHIMYEIIPMEYLVQIHHSVYGVCNLS